MAPWEFFTFFGAIIAISVIIRFLWKMLNRWGYRAARRQLDREYRRKIHKAEGNYYLFLAEGADSSEMRKLRTAQADYEFFKASEK